MKSNTGESRPEYYCKAFKSMKNVGKKLCRDNGSIDPDSPSVTWVLMMMAHLSKMLPDPSQEWIFLTNNFSTRHKLAKKLKLLADGEAESIGA